MPLAGQEVVAKAGAYDVQPAAAPFQKIEPYRTAPPATSSHHESMFRRGNAMSRAPIMSGTRKLPNPAAIGTTTMKIIVVPCSVKSWLYVVGSRNVLSARPSWIRISSASTPPTRKKKAVVNR